MFSVGTSRRVFFMYSDTEAEMTGWINSIKHNIDSGPTTIDHVNKTQPQPDVPKPVTPFSVTTGAAITADTPPRARLAAAKNCIPYLLEVCIMLIPTQIF